MHAASSLRLLTPRCASSPRPAPTAVAERKLLADGCALWLSRSTLHARNSAQCFTPLPPDSAASSPRLAHPAEAERKSSTTPLSGSTTPPCAPVAQCTPLRRFAFESRRFQPTPHSHRARKSWALRHTVLQLQNSTPHTGFPARTASLLRLRTASLAPSSGIAHRSGTPNARRRLPHLTVFRAGTLCSAPPVSKPTSSAPLCVPLLPTASRFIARLWHLLCRPNC